MYFEWLLGSMIVVAHTRANPEPATWCAMCSSMQAASCTTLRTLVFTDGGGPNGAQRAELERATEHKEFRVSVVSAAAGPRFIVSSMSLFNPTINAFAPNHIDAALAHLAMSGAERRELGKLLRDFTSEPKGQRFATLTTACAKAWAE